MLIKKGVTLGQANSTKIESRKATFILLLCKPSKYYTGLLFGHLVFYLFGPPESALWTSLLFFDALGTRRIPRISTY